MPEAAIPPFPLERVNAAPDGESARQAFLAEARSYLGMPGSGQNCCCPRKAAAPVPRLFAWRRTA